MKNKIKRIEEATTATRKEIEKLKKVYQSSKESENYYFSKLGELNALVEVVNFLKGDKHNLTSLE